MPAASIITTYLNPPFNRKVGFHNAFKQAMENAGFPATTVDEYDITDTQLANGVGTTIFNAGNDGSVKGFVKELTYNATANGTLGIGCFTRTVYNSAVGGSQSVTLPYDDRAFIAGGFVYTGGWNGTTKSPAAGAGKVIGGYNFNSDFFTSLAAGDSFIRDGNYGVEGHPFFNNGSSSFKRQCIFDFLNPIKFVAINHPEIRGVYMHQMGKAPYFIGICKPANPPSWFNGNLFPYAFMVVDSSFFTYRSFYGTGNPLSTWREVQQLISSAGLGKWVAYTHQNNSQQGMGHSNVNTKTINAVNVGNAGKRDVVTGPHLLNTGGNGSGSGQWLYGQFSNDMALTMSEGLQLFDKIIIAPGTEEYMVISTPDYYNFSDSNNPMTSRSASDSTYYSYYSMALRTV